MVLPPYIGGDKCCLFYAERWGSEGIFRFGISPGPPVVTILCPEELCAKKSFEDLLKHQAERIEKFEDLLNSIPPEERTFEQLKSLEDLLKKQENLLKSFEKLIGEEISPDPYHEPGLYKSESINLLDSFEDLLDRQYELTESFADLFDESKDEFLTLIGVVKPEFSEFLFSLEDLIRSQDKLLESFRGLLGIVLPEMSNDQKNIFLKSFEDLLMNQSELLKKFENILEWWLKHQPIHIPDQQE